jgi:tetratricopeptide (TPR) repeat protein
MTTESEDFSRVETLIVEGRQLLQDGKMPAAIARFRIATQECPGLALAWNDLGVSLYASKQHERAKHAFVKALALNPDYVDAALNYAILARKLNRAMDAAPVLREAFKHNPGDKDLLTAIRKLGLNCNRPVALVIARNSDNATTILQATLREIGFNAAAPDPRMAACCNNTIRLSQKSWERYFALTRASIILVDNSMDGTDLPLAAARAKGFPVATFGGPGQDLPAITDELFPSALTELIENARKYTPPKTRIAPPLTVITTTQDGAEGISNLLDHLALQDLETGLFEVIIIDDGSLIPVSDTIGAEDYPFRLQIIRQPRTGYAHSRNEATRMARGRWVLFFSPHAAPSPSNLRKHMIAYISSPKTFAVSGPTYTQPDLINNSFRRLVEKQPIIYGHSQMIHDRIYGGSTFPNSNVSIPRKAITAIHGFDTEMPDGIEEAEFGYRLEKDSNIRLKYSRELQCETTKAYDIEEFLKRQSVQGWSCHYMWQKHNDPSFIHGDANTEPHDMFFLALRLEVEQNEERITSVTRKLMKVCQLEQRVGESRGDEIIQSLTHRIGIHEFSRGLVVAHSGFSLTEQRDRGLMEFQIVPIFIRHNGCPSDVQLTLDSLAPSAKRIKILLGGSLTGITIPKGMDVSTADEATTMATLESDAIGIVTAGVVFPENWSKSLYRQLESWADVGVVAPNLGYRAGENDQDEPKETLHLYRRSLDPRCMFVHRSVLEKIGILGADEPIEIGSEIFFKQTRLAGFLLRHAIGCIFPIPNAQQNALTGTGTGG